MVKHKHNKPHFELKLSQLPDDTVRVLAFQGQEEISRLFSYRFDLLSEETDIDPADVLNKKATLLIHRGDDDPISIYGIISHFEQRGKTPRYVSYSARLVPKMWRLLLTSQTLVFQKMDIEKLVTEVLKNAGFSNNDFDIQLDASYPEMEYVVQYKESDFDFINRLCEHYGIFYYFEHRDDNDVIVFRDSNDSIPAIDLEENIPYNPNRDPLGEKDSITEIRCCSKVVTGLVRLKDYNDQTPATDLTAENQIDPDAPGIYYEYGSGHKDAKSGTFLAKVRNEEIYCGNKVFSGKSDCRLFRAGNKFKMGKHYRTDWNEMDYILTRVHSHGTQRALFAILPESKEIQPTFENEFEAIPFDIAYRPPRISPSPRVSGIMTSKVETGSEDEYAYIDDQGRYKIKSPFDLSDNTNGEASNYIRLAQPYSGPGYGLHFPNHADTEIVWACIDGDADRPLGLGTVPNPSNSSPSTSGNKAQSVIRTAGQNELTFDDTTDKENIILIGTKDWTIKIADSKDQTIGNNETLDVGNNQSIKIGANRSMKIGKNQSTTVGDNKTETVAKAKSMTIGDAYQVSVGAAMNETVGASKSEEIGAARTVAVGSNSSEDVGSNKSLDAGGNISHSAGENYAVSAGKKMGLACEDDFSLAGKKKAVIDIKDQLTIKCGQASITMKKNGEIQIKGKKINIKASSDIIMKGSKIAQN
jgi:type VI secretion system secreted protein VgrG